MKKINKIFGIIAMLIIMATTTHAVAPTFEVHKWTEVTGDWKWDGSSWQQGEFETANFKMDAVTFNAVSGNNYIEFETSGNAWTYELEQHTWMGGEGSIETTFNTWTLNDPVTTPATGGYSEYEFETHNYGEYTNSHLVVSGEGSVSINANYNADSFVQQDAYISIN